MRGNAAALLLITGCTEAVYGDGQIVDHTFEHSGFSAVESDGVNLKVTASARPAVVLSADWNVFPYVSLSVVDDTLRVSVDEDAVIYPTTLELLVSARTLEAVAHRGGADLFVSGLQQPALQVTTEGAGNAELLGSVESLTLMVEAGTGVLNAQDLLAEGVFIDAFSSGDMWVTATERISGTLYGSSTLTVLGKPDVKDIDVQGDNEVRYR